MVGVAAIQHFSRHAHSGGHQGPGRSAGGGQDVWDAYYANHQDNEAFRNPKVADIFMGGGTTLVEGSRLGMQMFGNDLNPVAWFVVKNRLAEVDLDEVEKLFDHIEREVKPQIMPFYACEGPGGERGTWTYLPSGEVMGEGFDPLALSPEERKNYSYEGPEVMYTFWAKHGPCPAPGCGHRTPLFTSPVVAIKTLSVKTWGGFECRECGEAFDVERAAARMAPDMPLVVAKGEAPFTVMDAAGRFACPHCGKKHQDEITVEKGYSSLLPKTGWKNKKISLSLLIHPDWMRGASAAKNSRYRRLASPPARTISDGNPGVPPDAVRTPDFAETSSPVMWCPPLRREQYINSVIYRSGPGFSSSFIYRSVGG